MEARKSPLTGIDYSFKKYLEMRKAENAKHMDGNAVPDYAYGMDYELRKKLDSIPGLFQLARKLVNTQASYMTQEVNMKAVCATLTAFPDVYEIGCECARRLGTAIPSIYIYPSTEINAYTIATDDTEPIIVLYSALYERLTHGELKAVIGHECGHFQNYHSTYQTVARLIISQGLAGMSMFAGIDIQKLVTQGALWTLKAWDRAAEVTADRAGMICADSLEDCISVETKLMYGAAFGEHQVDLDSLKEQLEMQMSNAVKFLEINFDHPTSVRRIMAEEEFAKCKVYYDWRPDLKKPNSVMHSREECDERCRKYIALTENAERISGKKEG